MSPRPRGFAVGFLAGLCWFGVLWFWIVHFRFDYEIVVVADRAVESVDAMGGPDTLLFPTRQVEVPLRSDAHRRILVLGGFRSVSPFKTVVLRVRNAGTRERRYVRFDIKAPLFARHCTAVAMLRSDGAEIGPCVPSETSWVRR
ncbi:MAG: hypothetical protein JNL71_08150 [Rhodospirillales bacterium]|nr:hypothetical protein [Rhodospirillales bacterium]